MKAYVKDAHANKQINTIASLVEDGFSDLEIAKKLIELGFKNLALEDGTWNESDINYIRKTFNLNSTNGFNSTNTAPSNSSKVVSEVVVTDIQMPFSSMVVFMVKWAIASIPALMILASLAFFILFVFPASLLGLFRA